MISLLFKEGTIGVVYMGNSFNSPLPLRGVLRRREGCNYSLKLKLRNNKDNTLRHYVTPPSREEVYYLPSGRRGI